jgi:hypothetical protein
MWERLTIQCFMAGDPWFFSSNPRRHAGFPRRLVSGKWIRENMPVIPPQEIFSRLILNWNKWQGSHSSVRSHFLGLLSRGIFLFRGWGFAFCPSTDCKLEKVSSHFVHVTWCRVVYSCFDPVHWLLQYITFRFEWISFWSSSYQGFGRFVLCIFWKANFRPSPISFYIPSCCSGRLFLVWKWNYFYCSRNCFQILISAGSRKRKSFPRVRRGHREKQALLTW